jgi:hypothetical protein
MTLFRSARSDEDGGYPANIAASGASNQAELRAERAIKQSASRRTKKIGLEQPTDPLARTRASDVWPAHAGQF